MSENTASTSSRTAPDLLRFLDGMIGEDEWDRPPIIYLLNGTTEEIGVAVVIVGSEDLSMYDNLSAVANEIEKAEPIIGMVCEFEGWTYSSKVTRTVQEEIRSFLAEQNTPEKFNELYKTTMYRLYQAMPPTVWPDRIDSRIFLCLMRDGSMYELARIRGQGVEEIADFGGGVVFEMAALLGTDLSKIKTDPLVTDNAE